jgi:NAD dependent epimerase/dehydratase family enzyme
VGSGRQWLSWISREDLAGLIAHLLAAEVSGSVNAASPHPVTNRVFAQTLGRVLGRPARFKVPGLVLRLLLGELADVMLQGQRTAPKKALASGFVFMQPDLETVLRDELG